MDPPLVCHLACGDDPSDYILLKIRPSWQSKKKIEFPASINASLRLRESSCCVFDTCISPLWGPLCPYIHSTVAFMLSHKCIRKSGRLLMGSSTRGSWGGKYIQPIIKSPSTWVKDIQFASLLKQNNTPPSAGMHIADDLFSHFNMTWNWHEMILTTTLSNPP